MFHSNNLYQIFTYVKNKDTEFGEMPYRVCCFMPGQMKLSSRIMFIK